MIQCKKGVQILMVLPFLVLDLLYAQETDTRTTSGFRELNSKIDREFKKSTLPGFSVVIVNDQEVLYKYASGYADIALKKPFTDSTMQNIASVSKTFIAFALMKAVHLGKLDLDEDINSYLPFQVVHPVFPDTPITLRHLATHTSGIKDEKVYYRSYVLDKLYQPQTALPKKLLKYISLMRKNSKIDDSEFLKRVLKVDGIWYSKKNFTRDRPGTKYEYSNIGATLAAFVLENAVDLSYEEFTKRYIFEPLQMHDSGWGANDINMDRFAKRYFKKGLAVPDYHLVTRADGALITSTSDFGKYLIEMVKGTRGTGTLLPRNLYEDMFNRRQFGKESSGIFWGVSKSGKPNHSGSDPGVLTNTAINPKRNLGVFFMTNIGIELDRKALKTLYAIRNILKEHDW